MGVMGVSPSIADFCIEEEILPFTFEDCQGFWVGKFGMAFDKTLGHLRPPIAL